MKAADMISTGSMQFAAGIMNRYTGRDKYPLSAWMVFLNPSGKEKGEQFPSWFFLLQQYQSRLLYFMNQNKSFISASRYFSALCGNVNNFKDSSRLYVDNSSSITKKLWIENAGPSAALRKRMDRAAKVVKNFSFIRVVQSHGRHIADKGSFKPASGNILQHPAIVRCTAPIDNSGALPVSRFGAHNAYNRYTIIHSSSMQVLVRIAKFKNHNITNDFENKETMRADRVLERNTILKSTISRITQKYLCALSKYHYFLKRTSGILFTKKKRTQLVRVGDQAEFGQINNVYANFGHQRVQKYDHLTDWTLPAAERIIINPAHSSYVTIKQEMRNNIPTIGMEQTVRKQGHEKQTINISERKSVISLRPLVRLIRYHFENKRSHQRTSLTAVMKLKQWNQIKSFYNNKEEFLSFYNITSAYHMNTINHKNTKHFYGTFMKELSERLFLTKQGMKSMLFRVYDQHGFFVNNKSDGAASLHASFYNIYRIKPVSEARFRWAALINQYYGKNKSNIFQSKSDSRSYFRLLQQNMPANRNIWNGSIKLLQLWQFKIASVIMQLKSNYKQLSYLNKSNQVFRNKAEKKEIIINNSIYNKSIENKRTLNKLTSNKVIIHKTFRIISQMINRIGSRKREYSFVCLSLPQFISFAQNASQRDRQEGGLQGSKPSPLLFPSVFGSCVYSDRSIHFLTNQFSEKLTKALNINQSVASNIENKKIKTLKWIDTQNYRCKTILINHLDSRDYIKKYQFYHIVFPEKVLKLTISTSGKMENMDINLLQKISVTKKIIITKVQNQLTAIMQLQRNRDKAHHSLHLNNNDTRLQMRFHNIFGKTVSIGNASASIIQKFRKHKLSTQNFSVINYIAQMNRIENNIAKISSKRNNRIKSSITENSSNRQSRIQIFITQNCSNLHSRGQSYITQNSRRLHCRIQRFITQNSRSVYSRIQKFSTQNSRSVYSRNQKFTTQNSRSLYSRIQRFITQNSSSVHSRIQKITMQNNSNLHSKIQRFTTQNNRSLYSRIQRFTTQNSSSVYSKIQRFITQNSRSLYSRIQRFSTQNSRNLHSKIQRFTTQNNSSLHSRIKRVIKQNNSNKYWRLQKLNTQSTIVHNTIAHNIFAHINSAQNSNTQNSAINKNTANSLFLNAVDKHFLKHVFHIWQSIQQFTASELYNRCKRFEHYIKKVSNKPYFKKVQAVNSEGLLDIGEQKTEKREQIWDQYKAGVIKKIETFTTNISNHAIHCLKIITAHKKKYLQVHFHNQYSLAGGIAGLSSHSLISCVSLFWSKAAKINNVMSVKRNIQIYGGIDIEHHQIIRNIVNRRSADKSFGSTNIILGKSTTDRTAIHKTVTEMKNQLKSQKLSNLILHHKEICHLLTQKLEKYTRFDIHAKGLKSTPAAEIDASKRFLDQVINKIYLWAAHDRRQISRIKQFLKGGQISKNEQTSISKLINKIKKINKSVRNGSRERISKREPASQKVLISNRKQISVCPKMQLSYQHVPHSGKFGFNSVSTVHYTSFIGTRASIKYDTKLTENDFQLRSGVNNHNSLFSRIHNLVQTSNKKQVSIWGKRVPPLQAAGQNIEMLRSRAEFRNELIKTKMTKNEKICTEIIRAYMMRTKMGRAEKVRNRMTGTETDRVEKIRSQMIKNKVTGKETIENEVSVLAGKVALLDRKRHRAQENTLQQSRAPEEETVRNGIIWMEQRRPAPEGTAGGRETQKLQEELIKQKEIIELLVSEQSEWKKQWNGPDYRRQLTKDVMKELQEEWNMMKMRFGR